MNPRLIVIFCLSLFLLRCGGGENKPVVENSLPVITSPSADRAGTVSGSADTITESVLFSGPTFQDVQPIFQSKCQTCHVKGSGLPVWTNYAEAFSKSSRIHERAVVKKDMPPAGVPSLTSEEIAKIDEWIKNGAVESAPEVVQQEPSSSFSEGGEASEGMRVTSAVPPIRPPVRLEGIKLNCRTTKKYVTKGVSKNRYLSAIFGEDLLGSRIYSTSVNLDPLGRIQTTENIGYLKSVGIGAVELCHQTIMDNHRCSISKDIVDRDNGTFNIQCPYVDNTVSINIKILNGHAEVRCLNEDLSTHSEYTNCRITNY